MAHGTGLYNEKIYEATIYTEDYAVNVSQTVEYYYEPMSDCYEPSRESKDDYDIRVARWYEDYRGDKVAGEDGEYIKICGLKGSEARKIWWALKNRNIAYDTIRAHFKTLGCRISENEGLTKKRLEREAFDKEFNA